MSVYRCNLNSIEKHQLFGSGVGSKGSALYLPAFHSRHHLFVPGGRKFSGRNNDQIEAGLWRQESKNSSRWIEGIDNDSVFRQGSEINHRLGGRGGWRERKGKRKKTEANISTDPNFSGVDWLLSSVGSGLWNRLGASSLILVWMDQKRDSLCSLFL